MSDKSELEWVKDLIIQYALDPVGEGYEALKELQKLHEAGKIAAAVDALTNSPLLEGATTLPVVERLREEIVKPTLKLVPAPIALSKLPRLSPSPDKTPVETLAIIVGNEPLVNYQEKLVALQKYLRANPEMEKIVSARLNAMPKTSRFEQIKIDIQNALSGTGKENFLGMTEQGPVVSDNVVVLGDIAGNIHASIAGDHHKDKAKNELGKHMEGLAKAVEHVKAFSSPSAYLAKVVATAVVPHLNESIAKTKPTAPVPVRK